MPDQALRPSFTAKKAKKPVLPTEVTVMVLLIAGLSLYAFCLSYFKSEILLSTIPHKKKIEINYLKTELYGLKSILEFRKDKLIKAGVTFTDDYNSPIFDKSAVKEGIPWRKDGITREPKNLGVEFGIVNPLLLVFPLISSDPAQEHDRVFQLSSLFVNQEKKIISVNVIIKDNALPKDYPIVSPTEPIALSFLAFNALDLGYNWIAENETNLKGLEINADFKKPKPLMYMFEAIAGGCLNTKAKCNMLNAAAPALAAKITDLPTRIIFKLWKKEPKNLSSPADFLMVINFRQGK